MAKSKWNARLKKAATAWKDSKEAYNSQFAADNLPEDTYVMKLQDATFKETGKDHNLTILVEYVILEGEHKGVVVSSFFNLESEWGPVFARKWFGMMETYAVINEVPEEAEDLEETIADIKAAEPVCKVRFSRNSQGYKNVDVISIIVDGEEGSEEGSEEGGEEGIDLEAMDKAELRQLIKDNDLEIDGWRKMNEEQLREAIGEVLGDGEESGEEAGEEGSEEGEEESVDLDELDKDGLLALIDENEIDPADLGFKNKLLMKKASEDKIRKALEEYMAENGGEEGGEGGSDEDDELLEQARIFCGTWDVNIADDADLDDVKEAMKVCEFPEKELDEEEVALLEKLELTDCIKKPAAKKAVAKKAAAKPAAKATGKKIIKKK